jgi:hypothetical protein
LHADNGQPFHSPFSNIPQPTTNQHLHSWGASSTLNQSTVTILLKLCTKRGLKMLTLSM